MPGVLNDVLKQSKCDIGAVVDALNEERRVSEIRITQKASKRLISILKEEIDKSSSFPKVLNVLSTLSKNDIIVNQIVNSGPDMSSICDKLLAKAISSRKGDIFDQKSLVIIFDLINQSDKLKSQLCMSVQEYILTSIEQKSIQNSILPKSMEILVSTVTHHQENRTFFIKNTSKEKIAAIFRLTKSTGNTMVQIFSVEFLWRVAIPMRMSIEEKERIFGKYAQKLYAIKAENFREGILAFVENINLDRTDSQRILQVKIRNLMLGSTLVSGTHNLYFGSESILLWISKTPKFSQIRRNIELVTLRKNDVSGIGVSDGVNWCIGITQDFDTLQDFFETSEKSIFFQVFDEDKAILTTAQQRFGKIRYLKMPKPRQLALEKQPLTPKIRTQISLDYNNQKAKKKSITPKTSKSIENENSIKKSEKTIGKLAAKSAIKSSPLRKLVNEKSLQTNFAKKIKSEEKDNELRHSKDDDTLKKEYSSVSESSDSEENLSPKKKNRIKENKKNISSSKKKAKSSPSRLENRVPLKNSNSNNQELDDINKNTSAPKRKRSIPKNKHENKSKIKDLPPSSESESLSSSNNSESETIPITENKECMLVDQEEIPLVKIDGSYKDDFNSDDDFKDSEISDSSEPNFADNCNIEQSNGQQIQIELPAAKNNDEKQLDRNDQGKFITIKKRHEYTPEKWELDTFDELKNFGSAIRSRLSERHLMLNRAIEDTVSQSLKEISDFMSKCDSDLDQLRNDFTTSSHQISNDIEQKKKMVMQLGEQQSEHINQMLHDCELLQKRAKELVKRFSQQKKALLTNQEKHIALFREDMRSEVKAAMTTKKRESSKKLVQKLVTLLDEL